jgi:hypothetical protein
MFAYIIILSLYLTKGKIFSFICCLCLYKSVMFYNVILYKILITNLIVGTVVLHPLLFYVSLILFLLKNYSKRYLYTTNQNFVSFNFVSILLIYTLFLGSVWALQSTSWGYLWVGDIVEWILLFKIIYILVFLHLWKNIKVYSNWFILIFSLLSTLLLIRLNLVSTRHNFISVKMTSYTIFIFYFLILEVFNKFFFFCKKYLEYRSIALLIVCLFSSLFILKSLHLVKYVYLCCIIFFFYKIIISFVHKLCYHTIILSFCLIWIILFNFFYLYYTHFYIVSYEFAQIFENAVQIVYSSIVQVINFHVLEVIFFKNLETILSYFFIAYNTVVNVGLNNLHLLLIFSVGLFIFKKGWI